MFAKALVSSNDSHGIEAYTEEGPAAVEGTQFYQGLDSMYCIRRLYCTIVNGTLPEINRFNY